MRRRHFLAIASAVTATLVAPPALALGETLRRVPDGWRECGVDHDGPNTPAEAGFVNVAFMPAVYLYHCWKFSDDHEDGATDWFVRDAIVVEGIDWARLDWAEHHADFSIFGHLYGRPIRKGDSLWRVWPRDLFAIKSTVEDIHNKAGREHTDIDASELTDVAHGYSSIR